MEVAAITPPYPSDTRAKGYRFELDYERIVQSDTWALASASQRPLLLMLWFVAWQQSPCGSMPDSDELIAVRIGMGVEEFKRSRLILLRGWEKADDGRLYHPVVSEMVLEMLARKTRETQRKADYRERMKARNVPNLSHGTDTGQSRESDGSDDTGTRTGTSKPIEAYASVTCKPATPEKPVCPAEEIIGLYQELMPDNPRVKVINDARKKTIRARWKEAASLNCEPFGYTTRAEGLAAWRQFFTVCAESDFLTGKATPQPGKPPFIADIDFLMSPAGFAKCLENKYHRGLHERN